jgi:hypothetical protein
MRFLNGFSNSAPIISRSCAASNGAAWLGVLPLLLNRARRRRPARPGSYPRSSLFSPPVAAAFDSLIVSQLPQGADFRRQRFAPLWRGGRDGHVNTPALIRDTQGKFSGGLRG